MREFAHPVGLVVAQHGLRRTVHDAQIIADRARLQFLLYQFRRAAICINQVATDRLVIAVGGSDTRQLLQEVFALLEQLAQELIRRIEETSSHDTKRMP